MLYQSQDIVQQLGAVRWKQWIPLVSQQVNKCSLYFYTFLILDVNSNSLISVILASSSQPYTNHCIQCLCE